jgi:large subunit ribosomal protein L9
MKLILTETITSLGIIGNEVDVAAGYARNYLLPQKKGVLSTPANRKIIEQQKGKYDLLIAKEKKIAEEMAAKISGVVCKISAKVSEDTRLYGSVTARDIADALLHQNIHVEKKMILLKESIKDIGTFQVPIRVYEGVEPEITVQVVPEEK